MSAKTKVWKNGTQRIGIANDAKPIGTPTGVPCVDFTAELYNVCVKCFYIEVAVIRDSFSVEMVTLA